MTWSCCRTSPWSAALLWLYTFLSSIVLVNLLVAMFAETYNRVLSEAEQEHRYQKAVRVFQHRHAILALPPPFNLPIIAFFALIALKDSLCSLPARARRRAPRFSVVARILGDDDAKRKLMRQMTSKEELRTQKRPEQAKNVAPVSLVAEKVRLFPALHHLQTLSCAPLRLPPCARSALRQVCADEFLRKSAEERATSLEGRLEATQAAVGLVQRRQAEASAEEQLAAMRKQHEEAMAALKQQAELQRQQLELGTN